MKPPSDPNGAPSQEAPRQRWIEPAAALIMAMTTVGTAWCSYQSATWTRRSNRLVNESDSLERRASLLNVQGVQSATIHVALFMQMLAAQQAGNERLATFYAQRFPPDLKKAYDAWLAQKPLENPNAAPHPITAPLYELRGSHEADEARSKAANSRQEARKNGDISGQYLANTVLFATVLFFANASAKFEQHRVRLFSFAFALAIFAFAVVRMLIFPR